MHRIMRLIIMFDLPVETVVDRKNYRRFRKYLIENGYFMMQYSIYSKILLNPQSLQLQRTKLIRQIPKKGLVELLIVTEKQYTNMEILTPEEKTREQLHSIERITEL